jgi:hypothetical protein
LKSLFGKPPLPALLHVHGVIMSAWCVLFFVQTYLVATHRVRVHRRLGIFGAVLAFLVVAVGTYATVAATARELREHVVRQFHFLFKELILLWCTGANARFWESSRIDCSEAAGRIEQFRVDHAPSPQGACAARICGPNLSRHCYREKTTPCGFADPVQP